SETTLVRVPATNHETRTGLGSVSHGRAAAATVVVPARAAPEATTPSATTLLPARTLLWRPPPTATRLPGSANRTTTTLPRLGLSSVERTCATGATSVTVRLTSPPTSQPIHEGRRMVAVTVSRSPGAIRFSGTIVPLL